MAVLKVQTAGFKNQLIPLRRLITQHAQPHIAQSLSIAPHSFLLFNFQQIKLLSNFKSKQFLIHQQQRITFEQILRLISNATNTFLMKYQLVYQVPQKHREASICGWQRQLIVPLGINTLNAMVTTISSRSFPAFQLSAASYNTKRWLLQEIFHLKYLRLKLKFIKIEQPIYTISNQRLLEQQPM
jgi:hypothetical protein